MSDNIPYGYCKCGCGQKAPIAPQTRSHLGHIQGEPCNYIPSHNSRWTTPPGVRFWSRVKRTDDNSCWIWQGAPDTNGYGKFHYEGRQQMAHRVAWILTNGPIPRDRCICHKCDNPPCVNPNHLFLGTDADNVMDKINKGRDKAAHGEAHFKAKLTETEVIEIRRLHSVDRATQVALAARFDVSRRAIRAILDGSHWKHLL